MSKKTFKNARVGNRVWGCKYGWGTINGIDKDCFYPIRVTFDSGQLASYTYEGVSYKSSVPTLFWNEFEIPEEAYKRPLPDLEIDAKVLVWDNKDFRNVKYKRHFAGWSEDGRILTWSYGTTSFSANKGADKETWDFWELAEEK